MVMARRQTLVQLTDDLVDVLDAIAAKQGVTRSALIRTVLEGFVKDEDEAEKDRRMIEGYTRIPADVSHDPPEWGDLDKWDEHDLRELIEEETWEPSDEKG
jgi:ribbon-helix-helix CopG family protein